MVFDKNVQAITNDVLAPKVVDTVLSGNILALKLLSDPKKWNHGLQISKSVQVKEKNNGGSFSGLDTFNNNKSDTKRKLSFDPKGYEEPVVVDGMERDIVASTQASSVEYVAGLMEEASNSMLDGIAELIYEDGTGNGGKDFQGLKAIVDDGSFVASYGGLSRSVWTSLQSNVYTPGTGLTSLSTLQTADSAARVGRDRVDLNVTTETLFGDFEDLLQPTLQSNINTSGYAQVTRTGIVQNKQALGGEVGFDALYYRGAPIVADEKCPDNKWYGLNTKQLEFYYVESKSDAYKPVKMKDNNQIEGAYSAMKEKPTGFYFSGLMNSDNQYGEVGHFILMGNLVSWNPNRHFVITFS